MNKYLRLLIISMSIIPFIITFIICEKTFDIGDIMLFVTLFSFSISSLIDSVEIKEELSKLTNQKNRQKKNQSNDYFVYNTNDIHRRYRKYEINCGRVYRIDSFIKMDEIPKNGKIVKIFDSYEEIKHQCITTLTRYDGVVFNTTLSQFIYPNGFIVIITPVPNTNWTVIDISDYNENTDARLLQLLQKIGSDEVGRFYVQSDDELLLILKIIHNLKGYYRYEYEYENEC